MGNAGADNAKIARLLKLTALPLDATAAHQADSSLRPRPVGPEYPPHLWLQGGAVTRRSSVSRLQSPMIDEPKPGRLKVVIRVQETLPWT